MAWETIYLRDSSGGGGFAYCLRCCWRSLSGQGADGGFGESKLAHSHVWCPRRDVGKARLHGTVHLSTRRWPCQQGGHRERDCLWGILGSKRKSHVYILLSWLGSHRPSQIRGGEHRSLLFMEGGSKNLRPCFKTAKDGSHWRTEAHVQSVELAHSM